MVLTKIHLRYRVLHSLFESCEAKSAPFLQLLLLTWRGLGSHETLQVWAHAFEGQVLLHLAQGLFLSPLDLHFLVKLIYGPTEGMIKADRDLFFLLISTTCALSLDSRPRWGLVSLVGDSLFEVKPT